MASQSRITKAKRRARLRKMGRKRKNQQAKKSTPSYEELFEALGAPSKSSAS